MLVKVIKLTKDSEDFVPSLVSLYVPDADATYQPALAAGATSLMEPVDMFYGDRSGGVRDARGNQW